MDVILTAGGIPRPEESLYACTQGGPKAMLQIAGKPMIQWVLDALSNSTRVERVIVAGLADMTGLTCEKPVQLMPNRGSMLENILGAVEVIKAQSPKAESAMVVASDIPAITSAMVDWLAEIVASSDSNVFYTVITDQVMEKRFPKSSRTYLKFKDVAVCGGDLNAFRFDAVSAENSNWEKLIGSRKNPLKQASLIGFDTLLLLLFRRLSLDQAAAMASKRLGIRGKAILCPYAEIGMDVDKPHQLEILQEDLSRGLAA